MIATIVRLRTLERERQPHVGVAAEGEAVRQYADDGVGLAIKPDVSPANGPIRTELRFPKAEVEKRQPFVSRLVFIYAEQPTDCGLHAKHRQQLRRGLVDGDAQRLTRVARQVRAAARVIGG